MKHLVKNALVLLTSLVLISLMGELLVRHFLPQQLIQIRPDIWVPHHGLGWKHRQNIRTTINTGERSVSFRTDQDGYRTGTESHPETEINILALGDSFIEGLQVDEWETLTEQLSTKLAHRIGKSISVRNAGVAGWNPNQYRLQATLELAKRPYDLTLVFLFLGNDIVTRRTDFTPFREVIPQPEFRWPASMGFGEWLGAIGLPLNNLLERHSHLWILLRKRSKYLLMRAGLSPYYLPYVLRTENRAFPGWETTANILAEIDQVADANNSKAIFILLPAVYQVETDTIQRYLSALDIDPASIDINQSNRQLGLALSARGLNWVDTTPKLRKQFSIDGKSLFGKTDPHLNPAGHKFVAEIVAGHLLESRFLQPTP